MLSIKPLNDLSVHLTHLVQRRLWLKVVLGMFLGAGLGIFLNPSMGYVSEELSASLARWLNLPGEIFMKLVQMVMIPLVVASIISGLASNVSSNLRSFGLRLFLYFIFTTVVAIGIGVVLAYVMHPGDYARSLGGFSGEEVKGALTNGSHKSFVNIPESISNLIPANPLESMLTSEMLSIVIFAIILGIAVMQLEHKAAKPVLRLVESAQKICMIVIGWAMRLVPFAVFGLMAALLSSTGMSIFMGLGYYMLVVILGLGLLMVFYMLVYLVVMRENPLVFIKRIRDPLLLAFSTASSAAVMPLSMKVADEKLGVSSRISDFVVPIGATINMDGTALYQCITVLFLAQVYGAELTVMNVLLITVTVVSASVGTPAIPGGGVIVLTTVLKSTGIPMEGLLVIIGIDRILGMFRTTVNVTGDLTASVIFNKWFGQKEVETVEQTVTNG